MCRPCALWYSPSVSRSPRTFFSNSSCYMSRNRNHFLHAQVGKTRLHTSSRSASPPGPPPQRQTMDVSGWHSKKDLSGVCQGLFKKRDEGGATQTKDWAVQFVEEPRRKEPLLRKEDERCRIHRFGKRDTSYRGACLNTTHQKTIAVVSDHAAPLR